MDTDKSNTECLCDQGDIFCPLHTYSRIVIDIESGEWIEKVPYFNNLG